MKESNIVSAVTELPLSCRSAMERMEREIEREEAEEDCQFEGLPEKDVKKSEDLV